MHDAHPEAFALEEGLDFLNHGAFGACPKAVITAQRALQDELELQPMTFMVRKLEARLDAARAEVAAFVGARPDDLVFVNNTTTGVNAVLRSFPLKAGDELLLTSHGYNACSNALRFVAKQAGATVKVIDLPFPVRHPGEITERVLAAAGSRTRLLLIDHITSPTGLRLPLAEICAPLEQRGVAVLVDGAHGPGMLDLDLPSLGASYYTGNLHKWCCAPKGAAFLWVREDLRAQVRPAVISHGASFERPGRSRFHLEFDWVGTDDPTAFLSAPVALRVLGEMIEGGWPALRARNRTLCLQAQALLAEALGVDLPAPPSMIGTLAALPLPAAFRMAGPEGSAAGDAHFTIDPLQDHLLQVHRIEVPIVPFPTPGDPGARLIRISAHIYNRRAQYQRLAEVLSTTRGSAGKPCPP